MMFGSTISATPFSTWLLKERENRFLLWFAAVAVIGQFAIFKFLYPYPNFMAPDSYNYLEAASDNQFINIWAIGYSKFLRLFSSFTKSHLALVWFQYLSLEAGLLYLLFTIRYLMSPGRWVFCGLMGCVLLIPLIPHTSNLVSSDALFMTLSLIWFTHLLWILYKPTMRMLLLHGIILLLAFMVRYNALYYPIISIFIIAFSHLIIRTKVISIGFIILLLSLFVVRTRQEYVKQTGVSQFSGFGGWQLGSNALYGYAHATLDSPSTVPVRFRKLHILVNQHMKSLARVPSFLRPDHNVDIYYLWNFNSPLRVYMDNLWSKDTTMAYTKYWLSMAPLYGDYGRYLIKRHPGAFLRHYVLPNLQKYYAPPTEFLGQYNLGRDSIEQIAEVWFGWEHHKVVRYFKNRKIEITEAFPVLAAITNVCFVLSFIAFVSLGGFKTCTSHCKRILCLVAVIWFSNMAFSVLAAPIVLRYQLFPIIINIVFLYLLLFYLIHESKPAQGQLAPADRGEVIPVRVTEHDIEVKQN